MKKLVDKSDPRLLKGELLFGRILSFTNKPQETIDFYKRIIEAQTKALGSTHLDTLTSEQTLASFYADQDMLGPALELQENVVEKSKITFGPQHPFTIRGKRALGTALEKQGNTDRGIELISAAVEESRSLFGESHPDSISASIALSRALCAKGTPKEAKILGEEALKIVVDRYGKNHPISISALAGLAAVYSALELPDEASPLLKRATEIVATTTGPNSLEMISLLSKYAEVVSDREEAEQVRRRVSELRQRQNIEANIRTLSAENHRATGMMQGYQWQEAEGILAKILKTSRETLGLNHETTIAIGGNLALCHGGQGDWDLARNELELIVRSLSVTAAEDSPLAIKQKINLASALMRAGKLKEAASLQEALLETTKRVNGDDHDETMRVMNNLAATYSRQSRRSDALALLLQEVQLTEKKFGKEDVRTTNVWARFKLAERFMEE
ncbi:TPR-like protein [Thozetella sp. PMI_491]|nr:TPR-like protein [Thozetella sp. PMI_491]